MKNIVLKSFLVVVLLSLTVGVRAKENVNDKRNTAKSSVQTKDAAERCKRASSSAELNINNVRCRINATGNMWYDGSKAAYYVPANGNSTALFCGALWIGGKDENEQLRVAALRFGQVGDDFWPGPLTADGTATTNLQSCNKWDKHYRITKTEVEKFVADYENGDLGSVPDIIKNWPAHGEGKQSRYIAPFYDNDGDGVYDYTKGDYPYYDFDNSLCPKTLKANLEKGEKYTPRPTMEDSLGTGEGNRLIHGGLLVDQVLKGDQTIFWVFNDAGNAHTESKSDYTIGLEIRAQAFAFSTNDEINSMTFYSYEIINRSTYTINQTYFSQWVDPDLGNAQDDRVGCDVKRGLGYCYNGKPTDSPGDGYYSGNPPAVGIDFFQGPYMDSDGKDNPKIDMEKWEVNYTYRTRQAYIVPKKDGSGDSIDNNGRTVYDTIRITDDAESWYNATNGGAWYFNDKDPVGSCAINGVNFGNGIVDDERFGMRRFVFHENNLPNSAPNGDPDKASDYYNYLCGIWKDNKRMVFGGNGHPGTPSIVYPGADRPVSDFMFPGDSDPWNWGTNGKRTDNVSYPGGWTEENENNSPGDRRFMQSAGPFTLKPGAVNYITVGIPWAKASSGGAFESVKLLRLVDDKCQALFDNCFKLLDGPDAPVLIVQEMSNQIILYLDNPVTSNNYNEKYSEFDPRIPMRGINDSSNVVYDRYYKFEGYQIFQVKDSTVSVEDIYDQDKSRLVAQCDIKNYYDSAKTVPIAQLINYEKNYTTSALVGTEMVRGLNTGIQHSFVVTDDLFSSNISKKLVNNQKYYYIAVAYSQNRYKSYDPESAENVDGQKLPYLAGRKSGVGGSIRPVVAMPHNPAAENGGTIMHSAYGESPEITRLAGRGNGGIILELKEESKKAVMDISYSDPSQPHYFPNLVYQRNAGPLNIKVIDPLNVKEGVYNLSFTGVSDTNKWYIEREDRGVLIPASESETGRDVYVVWSDTIGRPDEKLFLPLGISIHIQNVPDVAEKDTISNSGYALGGSLVEGALLTSSVVFADNTKRWLTGFADNDGYGIFNWIRSGNTFESEAQNRQYKEPVCSPTDSIAHVESDYYTGTGSAARSMSSFDKGQEMEKVVGGWWAPYRLVSLTSEHPGFCGMYYATTDQSLYYRQLSDWQRDRGLLYNSMSNLSSVDIVITSDKSKWSRCPVVEMQSDPMQSENRIKRFQLRRAPSIDKDGNPVNDGTHGMSWFPGYAINVETGERLNIFFGEDSKYGQYNGRDLRWNPVTSTSDNRMGSKHYIYILGNNEISFPRGSSSFPRISVKSTPYDEGKWAYDRLLTLDAAAIAPAGSVVDESATVLQEAYKLFANVMWVGCPLLVSDEYNFSDPANIPTDVTIKIRVRKAYKPNYTGNDNIPQSPIVNDNNPMYRFGIGKDMATETGVALDNKDFSNSLLDNIAVVPNPYYAASKYEMGQLDNRVRITNLPANAVVTIYTPDGTMVRRLGPSPASQTTLDWDLRNHVGIPIAGGVYLVHVKVPNVGETVIRWFGAMRPVDLNSYQF